MLISEETITQVRNATDIVEVVSEFVPNLTRAGKDFKGLCPFHQEKTPSFMVSPSKGIFHCFGCGVGGDIFKFVMELERCSYPEAIRKLAERKGIPLQKDSSSVRSSQQHAKREKLLRLLERATRFYHRNLIESEEAKEPLHYLLEKRNLTLETIQKFQLGWSPWNGEALTYNALKSGYSESDLANAGLVIPPSERSEKFMDRFRGRIIFPILDVKGQVVGFGGRILESLENRFGDYSPPKYINSPETEIFQKGRNLYGLFQGSKEIRDQREILILEGYMDVISSHQAGVKTAVAPLGTSLTMDQGQLLKRYVDQITLLFDSDTAGESATFRGAELLIEFGLLPMIARCPEEKDIDEYLQKHSLQDFRELLKKSVSIIEFKLQSLMKRNQEVPNPIRKNLIVQSIMPLVLKIPNEIVQSEMRKLVSEKLSLSEESLYTETKKMKSVSAKKFSRVSSQSSSLSPQLKGEEKKGQGEWKNQNKLNDPLSMEEELLILIICHRELRKTLKNSSETTKIFLTPICMEVYEILDQNDAVTHPSELLNLLDPSTSNWLSERLLRWINHLDPQTVFNALLKRIEIRNKEIERRKLERELIEMLNNGNETLTVERSKYRELTQTLKGTQKYV